MTGVVMLERLRLARRNAVEARGAYRAPRLIRLVAGSPL